MEDTIDLDSIDFNNSKYKFIRKNKKNTSGTLYVVTNASMETMNKYKIGLTKTSVSKRLATLNTSHTSSDRMYLVHSSVCDNVSLFERMVHYALDDYRDSQSREFFIVDISIVKDIMARVLMFMNQIKCIRK